MPRTDRHAHNQVLVRLTDEQDRKLRLLAAIEKKPMAQIVGELLDAVKLDVPNVTEAEDGR